MNLNNQQHLKGAIIAVIIAASIAILTVLAGDGLGDSGGKLFLISFSLIFFGITAVIAMVAGSNPAYQGLGKAGSIVSGLGFVFTTILVVGEIEEQTMLQLTLTLFIAAIALAHISLIHHFKLQNKYANQARTVATIFISLFSLIIIAKIFEPMRGFEYMLYNQSMIKIVMAALVADLAATLLVPLCNRLEVKDDTPQLSFTDEPAPPAETVSANKEDEKPVE